MYEGVCTQCAGTRINDRDRARGARLSSERFCNAPTLVTVKNGFSRPMLKIGLVTVNFTVTPLANLLGVFSPSSDHYRPRLAP